MSAHVSRPPKETAPRIEQAKPRDLGAVIELLAACGLPTEDVEQHFREFVVGRKDGAVCAAAGLEVHGHYALLRSVAVQPASRGFGEARALCEALLATARSRGIHEIYLLTTTAEAFFGHLGFERVARESVPAEIRSTREFAHLCPQTAVAMRFEL